ncbi:hypothetical protein ACH3WN_15430 [Streptomyces albogriseolus]|uniref:hypothetical protein n=1 Tax=Streptomyces albogriseolus TaxID=1887 RepID=UPI0037905731
MGFEKPFEDEPATHSYDSGDGLCSEVFVWNPRSISYDKVAKGYCTKNEDKWSTQDSLSDGDQTFVYWENRYWNGSSWKPYRYGSCSNNLGAPNWGTCKKNYCESSSSNYYGSKGSGIRFQTCRRELVNTACTPSNISDAAWINNNA